MGEDMKQYSSMKAAWHLGSVVGLRSGHLITPRHVQLILSDLCNQNCHFCLVSGTPVTTRRGEIPIEEVNVADKVVVGEDEFDVIECGNRWANNVREVEFNDGTVIRITGDHKILTEQGFLGIDETSSGCWVASTVSMQLWRSSFSYNSRKEMALGTVCEAPSKKWPEEHRTPEESCKKKNAHRQPHEAERDSRKGKSCTKRSIEKLQRTSETKHSKRGKKTYAFRRESNEKPCNSTEGFSETCQQTLKGGTGLHGTRPRSNIYRRRNLLGRKTESGLHLLERLSCGGDAGNLIQQDDRELCSSNNSALQKVRKEMSGGVYARCPKCKTAFWIEESGSSLPIFRKISNLHWRRITSIRRLQGTYKVFNIETSGNVYSANGVVVHNCAYRMDGGFSTEQFGETIDGKLVKNPNRQIPHEKAIEILEDCRSVGVRAVQFTGGGEPTVHPKHIDIFKHAKWLGLQTGLVTNGLLLRDSEVIADMDWVRVSLDAGREETYESVRESKGFKKVLGNLEALTALGTPCVIGVGFVVTMENWEEIYEAARVAKDCGAHYIRFAAMFSEQGSGYYPLAKRPYIHNLIDKVKALEVDEGFKVVDLFSHRLDDLDQGSPKYSFCGYQHFTTYIGGDLKVYRCCTTSYTKHGEVGDLSEMTFKEWLHSDGRKKLYDDFKAQSCHHCQFNSQNEVINYMVNTPDHVEFV